LRWFQHTPASLLESADRVLPVVKTLKCHPHGSLQHSHELPRGQTVAGDVGYIDQQTSFAG
jgi:hypothetical protein